ncbi:DUF3160 domain-containing protein [bacterium]|nr:DUF3160 domain-containing protein [bacterium]
MKKLMLLVLFSMPAWGQTMLADIASPVETAFGTYEPCLVDIEADAPQFQLNDDLSNVENIGDFTLTAGQIELLKTNHFVVTPAGQLNQETRYNEMFDLYSETREQGIPSFITTDAMLHGFHLCFDHILKTCEEERFFGDLFTLIDAMSQRTREKYETAADTLVRKALFRNLDYLLVASQLLNPVVFDFDPLPEGRYNEEISLIGSAEGFSSSPIFKYDEDYSQYKPRGHYTRSDSLKRYFKTMMWLGRMTFGCEDNSEYSRTMTLSAILLTQTLCGLTVHGKPAVDVWDGIYQPTVFFVGKSDDINFLQYRNIAMTIYGDDFTDREPDFFGDPDKLADFLNAAQQLEAARISYPGQPAIGWRFMGQRFVPDSWILDELVFPKIPNRIMPTGLDIMTVLGPEPDAAGEWAFQYVPETDKTNPFYTARLDSLKQVFRDEAPEVWAQNAYWNWLYCLMPLLTPCGAGYPYFMQTTAWQDKNLFAALASWAELRHDTILYAKQSGTLTALPPAAVLAQGYVEPNPHVFGRLASLARFMIEGLKTRDLLLEPFQLCLEDYADLAEALKIMAEKELTRQALTLNEYQTIFDFGRRLLGIVSFDPYTSGPSPWNDDLEPMPVVADVHTDANTMTCLEEGVGYPYAVYVLCLIEGRIVLTRGAGFSYYEFERPLSQERLTDEEWRGMLDRNEAPDPPSWTAHFMNGQEQAMEAEFYSWKKPDSKYLRLSLSQTSLTNTDTLVVDVMTYFGNGAAPVLKRSSPGGQTETYVLTSVDTYQWRAVLPLAQWEAGNYILTASVMDGQDEINYYAAFSLISGSSVQKSMPSGWHLSAPFPNPFNPVTTVRFSLPETAFMRIDILNIQGQIVRTLRHGLTDQGDHEAVWAGDDGTGLAVPGGVYVLRLRTGNTVRTQKLVLLR